MTVNEWDKAITETLANTPQPRRSVATQMLTGLVEHLSQARESGTATESETKLTEMLVERGLAKPAGMMSVDELAAHLGTPGA